MSLQVTVKRIRLGNAITEGIFVQIPYGCKYLGRSKTTAASINAKAIASMKSKLADIVKTTKNGQMNDQSKSIANTPAKPPLTAKKLVKSQTLAQGTLDAANKGKIAGKTRNVNGTTATAENLNAESTRSSGGSQQSNPATGASGATLGKGPKSTKSKKRLQTHTKPPSPVASNANQISEINSIKRQNHNTQENSESTTSSVSDKILESKPNFVRNKPLPPNYHSVKRKVTMVIVALPIALVTSWILFERLVLGKERRELVPPGMSQVEEEMP